MSRKKIHTLITVVIVVMGIIVGIIAGFYINSRNDAESDKQMKELHERNKLVFEKD